METHGVIVSGRSADNSLVEIIELADHPWFVASQFHPEFKSRPNRPHPLFRDFIGTAARLAKEANAKIEQEVSVGTGTGTRSVFGPAQLEDHSNSHSAAQADVRIEK
jgi:CTP synthase